jgi:hypothetical protein
MPDPLADVCLARISAAALPLLAAVRTAPNVQAWRERDAVWLHWDAGDDTILRCLLPIAGVELFARRGDHWYRPGHSLPSFDVPDPIEGQALARVVIPAPLKHVVSTAGTPLPVRFHLTANDLPRPTTALRCTVNEVAKWAGDATTRQLEVVKAALCEGEVVLLGSKLPLLPGATRFWGQSVLVPLGYCPEPNLPESALRDALHLAAHELALLDADGIDVIDQSVFSPLTRAVARLAQRK